MREGWERVGKVIVKGEEVHGEWGEEGRVTICRIGGWAPAGGHVRARGWSNGPCNVGMAGVWQVWLLHMCNWKVIRELVPLI